MDRIAAETTDRQNLEVEQVTQDITGMKNAKICLIFNPKSGVSQNWLTFNPLENIITFFGELMIPLTVKPTQQQGDGTMLARESIQEGYTHIIACGGDGTINEVMNGIIGTNVVLGIIPFGTANVLAGAMGIPLGDVRAACRHFLDAKETSFDIAVANERNYIIMSGIGFDAQIIDETPQDLKDALGSLGYIIKGAQKIFTAPDEQLVMDVKLRLLDQGRTLDFKAWVVLVANFANYSGNVKVALKAKPDDGLLDILIFPFPGSGPFDFMKQLFNTLTEATVEGSDVHYFQSSDFEIITTPPVPCQIDGELIGNTPIHYTVKRCALKVRL